MRIPEIAICGAIILGPSWTVAYLTEKVIYVIPMLALCTFVVAQLFQNRSKRLDNEDGNHHDGHQTGDH